MAAIDSVTFELRSGTGSISISHPSLTNSSSETMNISSIDSIKADFDLEEDGDAATSVLFNLGEFGFTAFDRLSGGSSLFEKLDTLSATDIVTLDVDFTTDGGLSVADQYTFTIQDMEYDRTKRTTSIKNAQQSTSDLQKSITDFFNNDISDPDDIKPFSATGTDATHAKAFIDNALPLFNSNNTSFNDSNLYNTSRAGGTTTMIIVKSDAADVDETLFELAASEGSIIGTIMGYNFITTRNFSAATSTSLSQSDVLDGSLKIKAGLDTFVGIDVDFEGSSVNWTNFESHSRLTFLDESPNDTQVVIDIDNEADINAGDFVLVNSEIMYVESTTSGTQDTMTVKRGYRSNATAHTSGDNVIAVFNPDASQTLRVKFLNPVLAWAQYDAVNSEWDNVAGDISSPTREAYDSYAAAYGANKARKVELTILDVDKLKPYEAIDFDSTFPNLIQGQTFRPSELEYDLEADKIKVKAYAI